MTRQRGMSLIELSVVLAIIGILAALSGAAIQEISGKSSPQNAAADLSGALALGHSRAMERSTDIYLIVYPNRKDEAGAVGDGMYFLLEDRSMGFLGGLIVPPRIVAPAMSYATFVPGLSPSIADGVLLEQVAMDNYPKKTVKFGVTGTLAFPAPFAGLAGDCSFCSGAGAARRGAIVFHADGSSEFLDAAGVPVVMVSGTAAGRSACLGLESQDLTRQYLFGVSSAAGRIALVSK